MDRLTRSDKTDLATRGSVVSAVGSGFGIPGMWWWHRIGADWGSVRPQVAQLLLFDEDTGELVSAEGGTATWKPNHLHQEAKLLGLELSEDKFIAHESLVSTLRVRNGGTEARRLRLYFKGKTEGHCRIRFDSERNTLQVTEYKDYGERHFPPKFAVHQLLGSTQPITSWAVGHFDGDLERYLREDFAPGAYIHDGNLRKWISTHEGSPFYHVFRVDVDLAAGASQEVTIACTFSRDEEAAFERQHTLFAGATSMLEASAQKHRAYFAKEVPQFSCSDERVTELWYYLWYVLRANRVEKGRAVTSDFTVPTKYGYWGCHVWDTSFHVTAEALLADKAVAADSMRALLSLQYPNGFLPVHAGADCLEVNTAQGTYLMNPRDIFRYEESEHPYRAHLEYRHPTPQTRGDSGRRGVLDVEEKTQTPTISMAAWELYKISGDRGFLEDTFPALARFDDWLWRRRNRGDGLVVWYQGEESGWDNASRLFPLPVKSVDGSCHAYLQRDILARMARILGDEAAQEKFRLRAETTRNSIQKLMWDDDLGFFKDLGLENRKRPQKSLAGFLPLLAGIATPEQVERLKVHLKDPKEFWTAYPVPTLSADDPDFNSTTWGWNGPIGLHTNWWVMEGLARVGETALGHEIFARTVELIFRDGEPRTQEHYDPHSGRILGPADFSWAGVLNHYVATRICGIEPLPELDRVAIRPRLIPGWEWLEMDDLRLSDHRLNLRYETAAAGVRLVLTQAGPRALTAAISLPSRPGEVSLRVNGLPIAAESFKVSDDAVQLELELDGGKTAIELEWR